MNKMMMTMMMASSLTLAACGSSSDSKKGGDAGVENGLCTGATVDTFRTIYNTSVSSSPEAVSTACGQLQNLLGQRSCKLEMNGSETTVGVQDVQNKCDQAAARTRRTEPQQPGPQPAPSQPSASLPSKGATLLIRNASALNQVRVQGNEVKSMIVGGRVTDKDSAIRQMVNGATTCMTGGERVFSNGAAQVIQVETKSESGVNAYNMVLLSGNSGYALSCLSYNKPATLEGMREALRGIVEFR